MIEGVASPLFRIERDNIQPEVVTFKHIINHILLRSRDDVHSLLSCHAFGRMPIAKLTGSFDFDKYYDFVVSGYDVDLFVAHPEVAFEDLKPLLLKIHRRKSLGIGSEFLAVVFQNFSFP